jgi:hypothetical protein
MRHSFAEQERSIMKAVFMVRRHLPVFVVLLAMIALSVSSDAGISPAQAHPRGTSIDDMTTALAKFQDTGNNLSFYPNTRFQILFVQDFNTGTGTFTVRPGTFFFVPLFSFNDSPPIIGDFPTNSSQVGEYIFGATQVGAHDVEIEVDGKATGLGPSYLSNLINTPGLPNGGSHTILMGVFLTPLPKGTHTVKIREGFAGDAIVAAFGTTFFFEDVYTVIVQ